MVRMCVGPYGEGANWTRHLMSGGGAVSRLGSAFGAFCGRSCFEEGSGDPFVKAGNGRDDEALSLLLLSLF